MSAVRHTEEVAGAAITVDLDAGGRLSSWRIGGNELLVQRHETDDDVHGWGAFPMVPWAGRVRRGRFSFDGRDVTLPLGMPPHAIHGTAHRRPWRLLDAGEGSVELTTDLGPDWPWTGHTSQRFGLDAGSLTQTITVRNDGDSAMPVSAGWHPWFRRRVADAGVAIDLHAAAMWTRDDEGIPTGARTAPSPGPWDDCFTDLAGPIRLTWPGVVTLEVRSDVRHVVVYDQRRHAVCVEPQSAPPDAHNLGIDLASVAPGAEWSVHSTWRWRPG